ncbi:CYTH domain-containing protein [Desulfolithobacter dissulfuricans]|uniref:CYTH domain-containing protein n=1 Tax=Desulfolithobacter dissulfuricans TaxID=2795293 RepID=A0A915XKG5_9BACT|nr:CYTH domain-containing protein [Desulfolithobacter dissulfuricans]BCO08246.1 CYTH domain-containing protein [Desulfolithobacter dissulfuricans]
MGLEIERKFLVRGDAWRKEATGIPYRQGYLCLDRKRTVRVRTIDERQGLVTIKGASTGATRMEFEYPVPVQDALTMLDNLCEKPLIEKKRYTIRENGHTWEVDEFFGENQGLVIAEIELTSEDQEFTRPDWVGKEVTGDPRYFNSSLIRAPYSTWKKT